MNRLASASSPYLRSAAHQPVAWEEFGPEAFARAAREDKPILLDVGAVWCHWCHVMDRESYEDPAVAEVIDRLFVAIKVDRDERPDVDIRYQKAVQALVGQGGWPLTAFLLPDGRAFYGGTYFPPRDAHGRPAFRRVLESVAAFYRDEREKAVEQAGHLASHVAPTRDAKGDPDTALRVAGADSLVAAFDAVNGGFGNAPKFPHTGAVAFALRRGAAGDARLREVALVTLRGMAAGGIHDRLVGGFHRYSVDAEWRVPHFEKMLYDNAELLRNFVHAYQASGDPLFARVARGTLLFIEQVLDYGASQDADVSPEDDGSYFTWTKAEIEAALPHDLARLAVQAWGVTEPGNFHGRNVLFDAASVEDLAAAHHVDVAALESRLAEARAGLHAARAARKAPFVDPTAYANWCAMAASAALEAAAALDLPQSRARALAVLERLFAEAWDAEKGMAHRLGPEGPSVWGHVDDQAQAALACTEAYVQTGEDVWLERARACLAVLRRDFADARGGYADTAAWARKQAAAAPLSEAERPFADSPTPGANPTAALAHLRVGLLTGDEAETRAGADVLAAFAGEARRYGFFAGTYFLALDTLLDPPPHVTVVAAPGDRAGDALVRAALAAYAPGKAVVRIAPGAGAAALPSEVRGMLAAAKAATAFVCRGGACAPPTSDPAEVARLVAKG